MRRRLNKDTVHSALKILDLIPEWNKLACTPHDHSSAKELINKLGQQAEHNYKYLARTHHPDLGGSSEVMKSLNVARDTIRQLVKEFRPRPATRFVPTVHYRTNSVSINLNGISSNATTSTTWSSVGSGFTVSIKVS